MVKSPDCVWKFPPDTISPVSVSIIEGPFTCMSPELTIPRTGFSLFASIAPIKTSPMCPPEISTFLK